MKCLLQNVLSLWDIYTLTPIWNWPVLHVEEFLLTTEAESPSSVTWYIMTLTLISLLLEPGFLPGSDQIFANPWSVQSMELSRPEYRSG